MLTWCFLRYDNVYWVFYGMILLSVLTGCFYGLILLSVLTVCFYGMTLLTGCFVLYNIVDGVFTV